MLGGLEAKQKFSAVLAALVLGALAIRLSLEISTPPVYLDFIVGNITWSASNKVQDLLVAPAFIVVAFVSAAFIAFNLRRQTKLFGAGSASEFSDQLLWWSLPATATSFALLLDAKVDPKFFYLSAGGIGFITVAVWANASNGRNVSANALGLGLLAVFLIALIPLEIALVLGRAHALSMDEFASFKKTSYAIASLGLLAGLVYAVHRAERFLRLLAPLLLCGQIGLTTTYLALYPATLVHPNGNRSEYETTTWLKALVIGMIVCAAVDVIRRFIRHARQGDQTQLLSPFAVFALLIALKVGNTVAPHISADDYHFGEALLGSWLYFQGVIPYVGYVPPHGVIDDDLGSLVSNIFYDGTAGTVPEGVRLSFALLAFAAFISLYHFSGSLGLAFVAVWVLGGKLSWFFLVPFLCLWFSEKLRARPSRWLAAWIITAPIVVLGVPPQGLVLVLASSVMAAWVVSRLWRQSEEKAWIHIGASVALIIAVVFLTPLGPMLLGAVRYVLENGPINQVAYGIPWHFSWSSAPPKGLVFEAIRMSWIAVPLVCLVAIYSGFNKTKGATSALLPAIVVLLFTVLLIPYSMGRIDPGSVSRAGLAAVFGWAVLLPVVLWKSLEVVWRVPTIFIAACASAALSFAPLSLSYFVAAFAPEIPISALKDGASAGLANIGRASVQNDHWDRLSRLNRLIGEKLNPGESYLDLTSRNAQYFYLNRKPRIAVTAPYNMAALSQQKLAVEQLARDMPRVALLEGSNIIHDGGGLALRTPYLYRFIVQNYEPFYEDGFIFGYRVDGPSSTRHSHIEVFARDINDDTWSKGVHRRHAAIAIDNPIVVRFIKTGDEVRFRNGAARRVSGISLEDRVVWLEGPPVEPDPLEATKQIRLVLNPDLASEYRSALLQAALSQSDLQKIPVAWGRSSRSLSEKARLIKSVDEVTPRLNQLTASGDRLYRISGDDPSLTLDVSHHTISGEDAGLLQFDFRCVGRTEKPRLQVFWWGDNRREAFGASSVKFTADDGTLIVPVDASPFWLRLDQVRGIRIGLINSNACSAVAIQNIALLQRRFE